MYAMFNAWRVSTDARKINHPTPFRSDQSAEYNPPACRATLEFTRFAGSAMLAEPLEELGRE
jgi:hypothetical protein